MDAYEGRVTFLNNRDVGSGPYVLYWMQHSQRVRYNHALEFAIAQANELRKSLIVVFGITEHYPHANERNYAFMLEGLRETAETIKEKNALFVIALAEPDTAAIELASEAAMVVVDRGYVTIERRWRNTVASSVACSCIQVETDIVVPVELASWKEEYSAATLRNKIAGKIELFTALPECLTCNMPMVEIKTPSFPTVRLRTSADVEELLSTLAIDHSVKKSPTIKGGTTRAVLKLQRFVSELLVDYARKKGDPSEHVTSILSPYLHFGQISPIEVYLAVKEHDPQDTSGFLEELVVRRELAINFCHYRNDYDSYSSLPKWAVETLEIHRFDTRPVLYDDKQLIQGVTGDPYWNAAQRQLVVTGFMHGYMRMYWGKKLLEWKEHPEEAYALAVAMNDTFSIDGRDPNGYAGIAWCFGKHDRPWKERSVFGMVRYMNAKGLERKFDMSSYVRQIEDLK